MKTDNTSPTPFDQYKLVDKGRNLYNLLFQDKEFEKGENGEISFQIRQEKYTTERLETQLPVQVSNIRRKKFKLKWFNNLPYYNTFPQGTFVTEDWTKKLQTPKAILLKETIETKRSRRNPLLGAWRNIGEEACVHDCICMYDDCQVPEWGDQIRIAKLKIYGKEASILSGTREQNLVTKQSKSSVHVQAGTLRYVEYIDNHTTKENGNPCHIEWLGKDRIKMTYKDLDNRTVYHEIWERVSLPVYLGGYF